MFGAQGMILVVFGIFVCFMGYSMFRSMLPLWGFILGGLVALNFGGGLVSQIHANPLLVQIGTFVVGGIIGALVSAPLYYVSVFLTGAAMGALVGIVFGAYLQMSGGTVSFAALGQLSNMAFPPAVTTGLQFLLLAIFGIITGGFAIAFQEFMISASTALIGAAVLVAGLDTTVLQTMQRSPERGIYLVVIWFVVGMLGLFIQYRMRDQT
jgi:hypothetical protein